tara:strand:+ start:179 stop:937 length:759 start_codon:yes stop_codon:yes gene_type:complete
MKKELKDKYVYLHRDVNNTIFYVGVGGKSRPKVTQKRSSEWKAIAKDGYSIEIHKKEITLSEAFKIEIDLIELIGRDNLGLGTLVNKTIGGAGSKGVVYTKEMRLRMSNSQKGKKLSKEHKKNISIATTLEKNPMFGKGYLVCGEKNGMFGKTMSKESREKISKANTGRVLSNLTRERMSKSRIGLNHSIETKNKMSISKRRRVISDENFKLLLEDYSKIDEVVKGVTFKKLQEKYNLSYYFVKTNYYRQKK